ncbi:hypothetical protein BJD99_19980 [Rhodococcus sp. 1163]|uniref:nuclear transport factor 2 family protein n=1 Tax=unclassified Rhodococcus (in: high G+C Gram-positive bacteria) TaxID=192944 RepID=UPI000A0589DA|nr:nuclear transport factor 2 family protein [Rhodococcus sp. 1163]ORI18988.1 hypothetical protein BJD99_19980 [Rhodococcus sp. 1163]
MHTSEDLVATIDASPAAVAVHDREAWVNLYARGGVVNDPVGSRPHQGRQAIEKFYDTFIAPNTINFHVENDVVDGMSVVRDLSLETIMSTGATLNVPMHIRYDIVDEEGELKIARLAAHWELASMIGQLLRAGTKGLAASAKLTPQLIGNQGIGGVVGFMGGLRGVGSKGKRAATEALEAVSQGHGAAVRTGAGDDVAAGSLRGMTFRKLIAAGNTVSATVEHESRRGVVFVEFGDKSLHVASITAFGLRPNS